MDTKEASELSDVRFGISHLDEHSFSTEGRRAFVSYRDLGVAEATGGRVGANVSRLTDQVGESTGWHYHTCDVQIFYVLKGWLEVELDGMGVVHLDAGACVTIPKGGRHNELRTSPDIETLEITFPAEIGTVKVSGPSSQAGEN